MMLHSDRYRSAFVILSMVAPTPAQAPTEPWRLLRAMQIDGVAAFDRDAIAGALASDETSLRALRQAPDAAAAATVASRVREMHRRGGYALAEAEAEFRDGVLHVRLRPGQRFRSGALRCSGNTLVPTARLGEQLDKAEGRLALWAEGEHPACGERFLERLVARVRDAYADIGRHDIDVVARATPANDRLLLEISLADEGHEVRIQSIALAGEDAAHREAVVAGLAWKPGSAATAAIFRELRDQLEATARYSRVVPKLPTPLPEVLDPLTFEVELRRRAPAPNAVPPRDAAQLRAAFDMLATRLERGDPLWLDATLKQPASFGFLTVLPGALRLGVARDGVFVDIERVQWGAAAPQRSALLLTSDRVAFSIGDRTMAAALDFALNPNIVAGLEADGSGSLRWGFGVATKGEGRVAVSLHPGIAMHTLAAGAKVLRDGEMLDVALGPLTLRIAADGGLADPVAVTSASVDLTIRQSSESFLAAAQQALPLVDPLAADAAPFLVEAGSRLVAAALSTRAVEEPRLLTMLQASIAAAMSLPERSADALTSSVPTLDVATASKVDWLAPPVAAISVNRRMDDRTARLAATCYALLTSDADTASAGCQAIAEDPASGPLTLALLARGLELAGRQATAARFADLAAERWSFAECYADAAAIGANFTSLTPVAAHFGRCWRESADGREPFAALPADEAGNLAAWRHGLELLWSAGGESALRHALFAR
jgi:hypothetical protein